MDVGPSQVSAPDPNDEATDPEFDLSAFLQTALDRFDISATATATIREKSLDDIKFSHNDDNYQWPTVIWQERIKQKRPILVVNQLPKFIRQVTNDTRQNRPSIVVHPVDDAADIDTAEVIQGLIRHIEYDSDAAIAYDTASDFQVRGGFGYIRVVPEYSNPQSFEQNLKINRVKNPFTIYFDPDAQQPDYSDARWCLVVEDMSVEKYKELYPDSKLASLSNFSAKGNAEQWMSKDNIRVAEYFYFDVKRIEIYQMQDGTVTDVEPKPPAQFSNKRWTEIKKLKWCKINAVEILEQTDIPIPFIPIVPVLGEECDIDGKRMIKGMVRDAQDSQRQYNYMKSAQTEVIALAPKSPFIAAEGQTEGYESDWQNANVDAISTLLYKPTSIAGTPVPPPRRDQTEPPVQAITAAALQAGDELKAVTGIYDANLGQRSNETSGRAIIARQKEGDTTNYHFADNLSRSIRHVGRILVEWIPYVYDTARTVRILGEDMSSKTVKINAPTQVKGQQKIYDLTTGEYDVTISVGPSFNTKREQAVDSMTQMVQAVPELFKVAGDLLVTNMDWPGAQQLAKRLKAMLPPEIQAEEGDQPEVPPQVQAKMAQMQQMIQGLTMHLNKAQDELDTHKIDNESKERIALLQGQVQLIVASMKLESAENQQLLKHEIGAISERLNRMYALEDQQIGLGAQNQNQNSIQNPIDTSSPPVAMMESGAQSGAQGAAVGTQ